MTHPFSLLPGRRSWGRPVRLLALLVLPLTALAQPSVTGLNPARNQRNAARASNVALTFNQAISVGTAGNIRIHSTQRGGQLVRAGQGTVSGGGTSTVTFDPATDFRPGETVLVTVPASVQNTGGQAANKQVYQFTTAAGGTGRGNFVAPATNPDPAMGTGPYSVAVGDVDGDGALDFVTANRFSNTVSVRLNDGTGNFTAPATNPNPSVGTGPYSVAVGDVDGDGDLDFVTANFTSSTVSVRLNNGTGNFTAPATNPNPSVGSAPVSVAVGDVDGDGDLDLLTANAGSDNVSVRLNDGTGNFTAPATNPNPSVGSQPYSVAMGDVDGDGDLDFVAANRFSNTVSVRLNDGTGNFTAPATNPNPSVGSSPNSVALGDVDGDGDLDFVAANRDSNTVSVRLNDGTGNFSAPATNPNPAVGVNPFSVALGDVDGDGDLDLLTANSNDNTVSVRLNDGTGNFTAPATNPNPAVGTNPVSVVLGDVDGDGDLDFVTANYTTSGTVSVRLNQPPPSLASLSPTSGPVGTSITLTGTGFTGATGISFNGTAALVFNVVNATTATATVPAGATTGNVTITTSGGTSGGVAFTVVPLMTVTALSPTRNRRNAAAGSDVAVTFSQALQNTAATQGAVRVFSQQRGGQMSGSQGGAASVSGSTITFNPTTDFKPGETLRVTTTSAATSTGGATLARGQVHEFTAATGGTGVGVFNGGSTPTMSSSINGVAVGDVSGDGILDLLTANYNNGSGTTVSVALGTGAGSYGVPTSVTVGTGPISVRLADIDGDGDLDFITANYGPSATGTTASVGRNNGSGGFTVASTISTGTSPRDLTFGDIDGDGDQDVLFPIANSIAIFVNNGSGAFSAHPVTPNVTGLSAVVQLAVGDVDNDGDLDLLTANYTQANTVSVRLNDGAGSFTGSQNVAVGTQPLSLAVGDVDADGDLDVLTTNQPANTVSVRFNNGSGTFAPPAIAANGEVSVTAGPRGLALGDVDGDGDLDFVSSSATGSSVRLNNGSGVFSAPAGGVATGGIFTVLGDVDGDGDLDLAIADASGTVAVRLNQAPPTITSFTPTSGPAGTVVTITGTNLAGATGVTVNGTAAAITSNTATELVFTVGAGSSTGTIQLTTTSGTATSAGTFTVTVVPFTLTGSSPARNATAAALTSNVGLTFSTFVNGGTAGNIRLYGNRTGRRPVTTTGGGTNTLTLDPATSFRPGELLYASVPATVQSAGGSPLNPPQVFQLTAAVPTAAPANLVGTGSVATGTNPRGIDLADIDNDGDLDLLTANSVAVGGSAGVSVSRNNGSGAFGAPTTVALGGDQTAYDVAAGDVDGDGDMDFVAAGWNNALVTVRLNNGSGSFAAGSTVAVQNTPRAVWLGDLDADGDLDLVAANELSHTVSVRFNNGSGMFSAGSNVSVQLSPFDVTLGDVDNDGDLDILASSQQNNVVSVRLNTGTGTFSGGSDVSVGPLPLGVAVADLNGDGYLDILAGCFTNSLISVRFNNGNGTFGPGPDVPTTLPFAVTTADMDGDGDLDILASGDALHVVTYRINDGTGAFSGTGAVDVVHSAKGIAAGDLDGDGDIDVAVAASNDGNPGTVRIRFNIPLPIVSSFTPTVGVVGTSVTITGQYFTGATAVVFNGTAATFTLVNATTITTTVPAGATTGPVSVTGPGGTGTSTTDFTVPAPLTVTALSPTRNQRNAARTSNVAVTLSAPLQNTAATQGAVKVYSAQRGGRMSGTQGGAASVSGSTIAFDPTNDFKPGETVLVTTTTAATATNTATLARGHVAQFTAAAGAGPGTFGGGSNPGVNISPTSVVAADVDGDGDLDLLTTSCQPSGTVSVRRNDGAGVFSGSASVAVGSFPTSVAAADVDGDGDLDLLTANSASNSVSVRLNDGAGAFSGSQDVPVGTNPQSLAVADVDGDGDLDLLTANAFASSDNVSVRFNDGAGTFTGTLNVPVEINPFALAVGDVDGDGDIDILTTSRNANTVSVRLNDGTGAFGGTGSVAVGTGPNGLALADVDGDGDLDFLAANFGSNDVSVRFNDGTGAFGGGADVPAGTNPYGVTPADVDGDGDIDLLATNITSNDVSVRLNDGAGVFSGTTAVPVGNGPWSVAAADVDGDGDLDLVAANTGSNSVSVRLNQPPAPTLTSLNPTSGSVGASITLTGTNFTGATGVSFNGTAAVTFSVTSATTATATVPAGASSGNVTITTPSGTSNGVAFTVITNQAPTALGLSPQSVAENVSGGTVVGTLSATDPDAGDTFTYTLVSGAGAADNGAFGIFGGLLAVMVSPNFEVKPSYAIRVRATDQGGLFTEQTFTITVTDENDQPSMVTDTNPAPNAVAENAVPGTSVGMTFFATDPDAGTTLTYSLPNNAGGRFQIDGATGVLTVLDGTLLNYEAATQHTIEVQVSDGSFSNSQSYIIAVTNVNEAPAISPQTFSLAENTANGTVVGTVTASDPDAGTTLTYTITAGNTGGAFSFTGNQLTVANSPALDFETTPSFALTVQVSDGALTAQATVTVNLTDVAESLVVSTTQAVPAGNYTTMTVTATGVGTLTGPVSVTGGITVQAGGRLNTACQPLTGAGSFTLEAGATLGICDAAGISLSGPTGAIQLTGARSFASDAVYVYNGTEAQATGSGLPTTVRELQTANASGVTLTQATAVTDVLRLSSGTLTTATLPLTLLSTATRTAYAVHAGGLTSGNVTVQRYVGGATALGYRHLASPVQATTVADLTTPGFTPKVNPAYNALPTPILPASQFPNIFGYDETRGGTTAAYQGFSVGYYSPATTGATLTPGRGYTNYMPGAKTPDFVGALTTGNVPMSLTVTGTNTSPNTQKAGWHLLGVPYPQPIDWDLATIPAGMSSSISVYRTTGGNNGIYLTWVAGGSGTLPNGIVPLGQGFFARATSATTFTFTNAMRVEANPSTVARPRVDARPTLRLTLTATTPDAVAVETLLTAQAGATTGEDLAYDGLRPNRNRGNVPTLASLINGQEAAVNALPETALTDSHETVVELTTVLPEAGTTYTLAVAGLANFGTTSVALLDRLTNTRYDLAQQPTLTLKASRANEEVRGRFAVVLNTQRVTGTAAAVGAAPLTLYPNPASAHASVRVSGLAPSVGVVLTDLAGRRVATAQADATGTATLATRGLAAGVYGVRAADGRTARLVVE